MIRGTIGESANDAGVAVVIDIRGRNVVIRCGDESWVQPATRVAIHILSPDTYQLVFGDELFVLRPTDPLQVRLELEHRLAVAARRGRWRRGRRPEQAGHVPPKPSASTRWVRDNVEVEAVRPADDSNDGLAWLPAGRRVVISY